MQESGRSDNYRKSELPSGLTLVSEYLPDVRSAALGVWVQTGSRDEVDGEAGMAHMVEHLLFKGTSNRSASRIAMEVDALGGHLNAFTTRELTCFYINLLDDRIDKGGSLLADIFLNSSFGEKDLVLERGVVLEEIKMCLDTPEDNLHDLTSARVWGDSPLGKPILGTPDSVSAFTRGGILDFFRKHYHSGKAILTAAGHVKHDDVFHMASSWFDEVPSGPAGNPRVQPSFHPGVILEEKPLNQIYIDINLPGIRQTDDLRYPAHVMNTILGGSVSSRLFQKIREEKGLVYSIYSGLSSHMDTGLLQISASTSPALASQVVGLIFEELWNLRRKLPSPEEIRRAKDHLIGNHVLSMESTSNRMNKLGKQEIYFGRYVSMEETIESIKRVDEAALEEVSGTFFKDGSVQLGFLGSAEGFPPEGALPSW